MTGSTMGACKRPARASRWRAGLALLLWLPAFLWAAGIDIRDPRIVADEDGWHLAADATLDLPQRLEEAVNRGVALHFVAEFELVRERWAWFDDQVLQRRRTAVLSYHALTRQYRVALGGLRISFATLGEALRFLGRAWSWMLVEAPESGPRAGTDYRAALRIRLDTGELPRPFQLAALTDRDWTFDSGWRTWSVTWPAREVR